MDLVSKLICIHNVFEFWIRCFLSSYDTGTTIFTGHNKKFSQMAYDKGKFGPLKIIETPCDTIHIHNFEWNSPFILCPLKVIRPDMALESTKNVKILHEGFFQYLNLPKLQKFEISTWTIHDRIDMYYHKGTIELHMGLKKYHKVLHLNYWHQGTMWLDIH